MSIFKEFKYKTVLSHCAPKMEKEWQPGNLVVRKFLKNQALTESFWILLLHFFTSRQIRGSVKEMISVFLENGHIFHPLFHKIPEKQYKFQFLLYQGTFMFRKYVILWKKLGPLEE